MNKLNYNKAIQFVLSKIKSIPLEINHRYCRVSVTVLGGKSAVQYENCSDKKFLQTCID